MSHQVIALAHDDLDVTDPAKVERLITRERPGAVINCAAWTNVDGAEESEHDASLVNAQGAGFVADAAAKVDAKRHLSLHRLRLRRDRAGPTANRTTRTRSTPTARPSSAASEPRRWSTGAASSSAPPGSSGPRGGNFVETMLRLGQGGGPVVVVHDQVGCPTYTGHLAVGLLRLVDSAAYGIHHMAGEGSCSWYEFALEIFRQAEVVTRVMATTTDMMERPAKRPANSVLVSRRSAPIKLPPWQRGLSDYLARRGHVSAEEAPRKPRSSACERQPVLDWTEPRARGAGGRRRGDHRRERAPDHEAATWRTGRTPEDEGQDAA